MSLTDAAVDRFLRSALKPIQNTDRVKYPLTPARLKDYYLDLAARDFLQARRDLEAAGWDAARMAQTFHNPSRVMRMSYYLLEGARRLGHGVEHQRELLAFLISLVSHLKVSDPVGEDGVNLQHPPDVALRHVRARGLSPADAAQIRSFHRLAGALRTYMDAVYLVPHDVGMEMYGPYLTDDRSYLVRSFFNLRPVELWPETARLSVDAVTLDGSYARPLDVRFDLFNNPYVSGQSYLEACLEIGITLDGRPATPAQVEALTSEVMGVIRDVVARMATFSPSEQAAVYMRCFWLRMSGFLNAAGRPSTPPPEVFQRLQANPAPPEAGPPPTLQSLREGLGLVDG